MGCSSPSHSTTPPSQQQACIHSADCPSGSYCDLGLCTAGSPGDGDAMPAGDPAGGGDAIGGDPSGGGDAMGGDPSTTPTCNCSPRQTCNTTTGTCTEPVVCTFDADCNAPRICFKGTCTDPASVGCRSDADCPGGHCDIPSATCETDPCSSNQDCASGRYCYNATSCAQCGNDGDCLDVGNVGVSPAGSTSMLLCVAGTCVEPESGYDCQATAADPCCTGDADCLPGRTCNTTTHVCEHATCPTDPYEPNNGPIDANANAPIGSGTYNVMLCDPDGAGDPDWFALDASPGDGVLARASFDLSYGPAEMSVLDATGADYADAQTFGDVAVLSLGHLPDTASYLWLFPVSTVQTPVTVDLTIVPGGFCLPDALEPNNTAATATDVGADADGITTDYEITFCSSDDSDWFKGTVSVASTVEVVLTTKTPGPPPTVDLYAPDSTTLVLRDTTPYAQKVLDHDLQAGDAYFVRIYPNASTNDIDAELNIATFVP